MPEMTITCDRCHEEVQGFDTEEGTSGFYNVTHLPWSKYANPDETRICDSCMWADERYLNDYPHMRGVKGADALTLGRDL